MIFAATGHRPPKLGGYGVQVEERLFKLALNFLMEHRPQWVITGMALGWDMAVAEACMVLRIPYTAAIPFTGQESKWPRASQDRYDLLLRNAAEVVVVSTGGYAAHKMHLRDKWMVDRCDRVIALWNGTSGGTAYTVGYAENKRRPVVNLWDQWEQHENVLRNIRIQSNPAS